MKPNIKRRGLNSFEVSMTYKGKRYRRCFKNEAAAYTWITACSQAHAVDAALLPDPATEWATTDGPAPDWCEFLDHAASAVWSGTGATMAVLDSKRKRLSTGLPPNFLRQSTTEQQESMNTFKFTMLGAYSRSYTASVMRYLDSILLYAHAQNIIPAIPKVKKVSLSEGGDRSTCLTAETVKELKDATLELGLQDLADFITVAVVTGVRPVELLDLCNSDVLGSKNLIRVYSRKTKSYRVLPISGAIRRLLMLRGQGSTGPFATYTYRNLIRDWGVVRSHLGQDSSPDFVPYILRHTYITTLLEKGVALPQVQKLAGHKRLSTTAQYIHMTDADADSVRDKLNSYHLLDDVEKSTEP